MGILMLLVLGLLAPVGGYIYYVAIHKPKAGRAMQEAVWKPLAERLGGRFTPSPGGARFHTITIPYGTTMVTAIVFDRAVIDGALSGHYHQLEVGGWRTFVQANVVGGHAPAMVVEPGKGGLPVGDPVFQQHHRAKAVLGTPDWMIAQRVTPQLCQTFGVLGRRYNALVAGPTFVSLEIPGICSDPALIEAAIHVVGGCAQPTTAYAVA